MARVRCLEHRLPAAGGPVYVLGAAPAGDGSALICGLAPCASQGVLWLDGSEADAYADGQRTFGLGHGDDVRLRASDWIVWSPRAAP